MNGARQLLNSRRRRSVRILPEHGSAMSCRFLHCRVARRAYGDRGTLCLVAADNDDSDETLLIPGLMRLAMR